MDLLLTLLAFITSALALSQSFPQVNTVAGPVRGAFCSGTSASSFLGVPFAESPVGNLRFESPQKYSAKYAFGGLNATTPAPTCIQFGTQFLESGETSEDCLYLNIWTPPNANPGSNLPVKVWIYGGGDLAGGISDPLYNGCNIAEQGSILVSINYRLGPLGFLAVESAGIAGNFGIEDILLGLEWIQSNIAAFGGDTKKVLLFGQSAGASSAWIVSTLPKATSLISAAAMESGGGTDFPTSSIYYAFGSSYAQSLNCSNAACLRSIPIAELNASIPNTPTVYSNVNPNSFGPYIDGKIIPYAPSAVGTKVPSIYGSNSDDGTVFTLGQYLSVDITSEEYASFIQENFGPAARAVAQQHPLSAFNSSKFPGFTAVSTLITDVSYFCPAHRALNLAIRNGIPAYTYRFSHTPSCLWDSSLGVPAEVVPLLGAAHTAEIPFVFGNVDNLPLPNGTCNFTAAEDAISHSLLDAWTAMAATSSPSSPNLTWPLWNAKQSLGVNIGNEVVVGAVNYSACEFWDGLEGVLNFTTSRNGTTNATAVFKRSVPTMVFTGMGTSLVTSGSLLVMMMPCLLNVIHAIL